MINRIFEAAVSGWRAQAISTTFQSPMHKENKGRHKENKKRRELK